MAHPITAEDHERISASLSGLEDAREVLKRLEGSGIDVSERMQKVNDQTAQLKAIRDHFPAGE